MTVRRVFWLGIAALAACSPEPGVPAAGGPDMIVETDVAVPMRDGTVLRADLYRPSGEGPFPVLVYRTPYGKHDTVRSYRTHVSAVERGYAVVIQDVRGRYASDGDFHPYRNEGRDGYDTIEWAARQGWSDGNVGTFGLSYPGAVQWLAAIESPPSLKAMVPAMTFSSPRNFFYMNGIFDLSWLPWIYFNIAPDARVRADLPGSRSYQEAAENWDAVANDYFLHLPLNGLPYLREEAPWYFEWLEHPPESAWWDWAEIRGRYADVEAAVLNLSGWYDEAYGPEGAITNHNGIVASRDGDARSHLVMGPWKHGVIETGQRVVGDLDFGPDAGIDYDDVILRFFDEYLQGRDTGLSSEAPVRYFITGSNTWREAERWPPPADGIHQWCLAPGRVAPCADVDDAPPSRFMADPANPVVDPYDSFGPHDYSALAARSDVLTYDSEILEGDLTLAGNALARVFVSCDCRDFDLWFRLQEVHPDGRAINIRSPGAEVMRASYRDINNGQKRVEPGEIVELQFRDLMVANTFRAGNRIRVQVSASFMPHLSRNLQTGASEIVSAESRPAEITLHHEGGHRTAIYLPVLSNP